MQGSLNDIPTKIGAGLQAEERFDLFLFVAQLPGDNGRYNSFIICYLCGYWLYKGTRLYRQPCPCGGELIHPLCFPALIVPILNDSSII